LRSRLYDILLLTEHAPFITLCNRPVNTTEAPGHPTGAADPKNVVMAG
jgi:hypothetical protein